MARLQPLILLSRQYHFWPRSSTYHTLSKLLRNQSSASSMDTRSTQTATRLESESGRALSTRCSKYVHIACAVNHSGYTNSYQLSCTTRNISQTLRIEVMLGCRWISSQMKHTQALPLVKRKSLWETLPAGTMLSNHRDSKSSIAWPGE